ncbi:Oidioi.mRNA.OKI2018_I69.PAR.g11169.t2.cds [Oikopleura dioica]|uniref:Oidioi.mRNA.OKI2018_I69.PAR.g11169.t2.cds n=1 Tax=Oikopleura dioica TaxID=34765 RepID=A0ABN7RV65_OIKDI|nr:Oidioi.mRNA.OKI2018_I69.PAR.g11169.t2.cds [Oikopleura dioica]
MKNRDLLREWDLYTNHGKPIEGTNIILCRTPLRQTMFRNNKLRAVWTPEIMIKTIEEAYGKPIGLVIDMTATSKYYYPSEIYNAGKDYYKLPIPGGKPPPEGYVQQFIRVIDSFLLYRLKGVKRTVPKQTTGIDDLNMEEAVVKTLEPEAAEEHFEMMQNADFNIVIHCTHGVNRSGYVVARYLIDKLGISAEDAILRVEDSRGHQMSKYRNVLLDDDLRVYLRNRMSFFYGVSTLLFHPFTPDSKTFADQDRFSALLPHELEIEVPTTPSCFL